jgi:hypothetical protein
MGNDVSGDAIWSERSTVMSITSSVSSATSQAHT